MDKLLRFSLLCLMITTLGLSLTSCGKNPHVVDLPQGEIGNNDPIQDPDPDPTPTPTPTPLPPGVHRVKLAARDYDPANGTESADAAVELPYTTKKVKTIGYGKTQRGIMCRLFGGDNCTRNRQVLFAFDIPELGTVKRLHDVRLRGNFVTYGLSFKTELLCLNNLKRCSGNGIKKIPVLGLSTHVKKKWWNQNYWAEGYEAVVLNNLFQESVNTSTAINKSTRLSGPRDFSLRALYDLNDQDILDLLQGDRTLWFTVADDTFVMTPELEVIYE